MYIKLIVFNQMALHLMARTFHNLVPRIFYEELDADVIVNEIRPNNIIVQIDGFISEFITNFDISDLQPGAEIKIRYKFVPDPINIMTIKPFILFYCIKSRYKHHSKQFNKWTELQSKLNHIRSIRFPPMIYRIGLIVIEPYMTILDTFKSNFKSKCLGDLFIYKLDTNIEFEFINAINYFNKYHEIDLICILTESVQMKYLFKLSSTYVISHMKPIPYTIYLGGDDYLISKIVDMKTDSVFKVINLIQQTQLMYKMNIQNSISDGIIQLENMISSYKIIIDNLNLTILDLNPLKLKLETPIAKFKMIAKTILTNELNKLSDIEFEMSKSITNIILNG